MIVQCLNCRKVFEKDPSQLKVSPKSFCSKSCAASYNNRAFPKRAKTKACKSCLGKITSNYVYCSKKCNPRSTSALKLTLGEVRKRHKFSNKYANVRVWARKVYEQTGRPKHCEKCGYNKTYQVCHIRAISSFPDSATLADINHPSNLTALCPNHHWELDHPDEGPQNN